MADKKAQNKETNTLDSLYEVGMRVNGRINNITNLGIFVTLDKSHSGLVHKSDFADWPNERAAFSVDQEIRTVIVSLKNDKIGLSVTRVADATLVDKTNKFAATKPNEFEQTLADVLESTNEKLAKLNKQDNGR